jgi:hypothetical protein
LAIHERPSECISADLEGVMATATTSIASGRDRNSPSPDFKERRESYKQKYRAMPIPVVVSIVEKKKRQVLNRLSMTVLYLMRRKISDQNSLYGRINQPR